MNEDRSLSTLSTRRERAPLPPRQAEPPAAGLGEVARDVVDHAQVIARDALAIAKLSARQTMQSAKARAKETAPRIAFGVVSGVAALVGVIFLLIAVFLALEDAIPSPGWRMAIFGMFFLVVALVAALFASGREDHPDKGREVEEGSFSSANEPSPLDERH